MKHKHLLSAVGEIDLKGNIAYQLGKIFALLAETFDMYRQYDRFDGKIRIYIRKVDR